MRIAKVVIAAVAVVVIAGAAFYYLAPQRVASLLINLQRRQAGLERKEIQLPGGLHYVYLEGGKGEPLMLLHGFGMSKNDFGWVARYLTPHYRVIAPDHIGFGESSHPQDVDYGPVAQARRLRDFAHSLGITRFHLGGNSMGGQIALTYAALYPDEVESLWLLDPAGVWSAPKSTVLRTMERTGKNLLMVGTQGDLDVLLSVAMKKPPIIPRPLRIVMARERIKNYALEERIGNAIIADSIEERVNGLKVPALIVWGREDQVVSVETADVLHKLMPQSKVVIMPGIGHVPMIENAEQSARDYMKFRAELEMRDVGSK
jgi:pimeloyl-ACP methyl ester carboxylesterase